MISATTADTDPTCPTCFDWPISPPRFRLPRRFLRWFFCLLRCLLLRRRQLSTPSAPLPLLWTVPPPSLLRLPYRPPLLPYLPLPPPLQPLQCWTPSTHLLPLRTFLPFLLQHLPLLPPLPLRISLQFRMRLPLHRQLH
ncbi:unnamed protein product, partial [Pylaiella littoralis]